MSQIRRCAALLLAGLVLVLLGAGPASAIGDDYPYRTDTTGSADRWGFTRRQCVSFVAWRMEQRGVHLDNPTQQWGSALTWDDTARRLGYRVGTRPVPGAIAQWNAYERSPLIAGTRPHQVGWMSAGSYGHVGYVRGVYKDGSVSVEQYNFNGLVYSTMRVKAPRYLYVSVAAPR